MTTYTKGIRKIVTLGLPGDSLSSVQKSAEESGYKSFSFNRVIYCQEVNGLVWVETCFELEDFQAS